MIESCKPGVAPLTLLGHTIASHQIRKDLSAPGPLGQRGHGYAINPLVERPALVLGLEHDWRITIAIFDNSPTVIGQEWQDIRVHDVNDLERVLPGTPCNIDLAGKMSILTHRLTFSQGFV